MGITSYYSVILKRVILHDGIKIIQNGVFLFSLNKELNVVSFQKTQTSPFFKPKKTRWVV